MSMELLVGRIRGYILELPAMADPSLIDEKSRGCSENMVQEAVPGIQVDTELLVKNSRKEPLENGLIRAKVLKLRFHDDVLLDPLSTGTAFKKKNSYMGQETKNLNEFVPIGETTRCVVGDSFDSEANRMCCIEDVKETSEGVKPIIHR